jgi:hypothetical protein
VQGENAWIESLPQRLVAQQRLLRLLLERTETEPDARWLVVGCSLARGNADELSDIDAGMGVTDGEVEPVTHRVLSWLQDLPAYVAAFEHRIEGLASPHRRVFAQFEDLSQLDLVLVDASDSKIHDAIVLYDPDSLLVASPRTDGAAGRQVGEWAGLAWESLVNLAKYLRRGSPWEAHGRLERARELTWRMWAADRGVSEPQFGITSLLDAGADETGLEPTVAGLGAHELLHAARELAVVLKDLQEQFAARGYEVPVALADFVSDYLDRFQVPPTA